MSPDRPDPENRSYDQHERLVKVADQSELKVKLSEVFLPLYHRLYDPDDDFVTKTRAKLGKARVDATPEMYISRALGYGVITGISLWIFTLTTSILVLTFTGFEVGTVFGVPIDNETIAAIVRAIRTPAILFITGVVCGVIGGLTGFYGPFVYLGLTASSREREINTLLPDSVSYMYALSVGGMNQIEIIRAVAESEDVYGEVSREFQTIIQETEYFDIDYKTAIQHRARETPSSNLSQFLADMLSILNSGGDLTEFLDDKTDKQMRVAKENQKDLLEMLELFGEMYLNLSLLPLLLIILITIMQLMGGASDFMLYSVIYILIPMLGFGFVILISTVLPDDPGDGNLSLEGDEKAASNSLLDFSTTKEFKGLTPLFNEVHSKELKHRTKKILKAPHKLFIERPLLTLLITVPVSIAVLVAGVLSGIAPRSIDEMFSGLWGTAYYFFIPMYIIFIPLTVFNYLHTRRQKAIVGNYSEALRKLSSANDTGQTLLESYMTVAETSTGLLAKEFREINAKVDYNYSLRQALTEFNNKYSVPELARINNLIIDAQETSSNISDVLVTAARTSENQDKLRRERASRTRMQLAMIIMTYFVLMAVIAMMQDQFVETIGEMAGDVESGGDGESSGAMDFEGLETTTTGVLFFHAVTIQAVTAGVLCSYLQSNTFRRAGIFILPMATIALIVWALLL